MIRAIKKTVRQYKWQNKQKENITAKSQYPILKLHSNKVKKKSKSLAVLNFQFPIHLYLTTKKRNLSIRLLDCKAKVLNKIITLNR